jgi:hypothetical protein
VLYLFVSEFEWDAGTSMFVAREEGIVAEGYRCRDVALFIECSQYLVQVAHKALQ